LIKVKSTVTINTNRIRELRQAHKTALKETAGKLHTAVVQAQVVPRMDGHLQNEKFYVDTSKSHLGKVRLVHEGPYACRLYYHPEYNFHQEKWEEVIVLKDEDGNPLKNKKGEIKEKRIKHDGNPNAKAHWFDDWLPGGKYQDFVRLTYTELLKKNGGL
jgi:hypothetical protein